ncbi:endonuclease/exonuclease/phosphatase family protein [Medicago truncatula]|uniref:Endonuclease/exonuclease/phosphatase family protein n=1 Tax=Medicago truncatula TaxID=3880 RepID=A0A072VHJ9_MEDTR|nr:endonuclease/exonuclease/phosphatase family protein [Medicago truncatula]
MAEALIATLAFLSAIATTIMIRSQDMGFNHVADQGPVSRVHRHTFISNINHSSKKSAGSQASAGILTLWDTSKVEVWDNWSLDSSLIIYGRFVKSGCEFFTANAYVPCDPVGRQTLWLYLGDIINNNKEDNWCICGDFNAIRSLLECRSRALGQTHEDFTPFNQFIDSNTLFDLLLRGRIFTWF